MIVCSLSCTVELYCRVR